MRKSVRLDLVRMFLARHPDSSLMEIKKGTRISTWHLWPTVERLEHDGYIVGRFEDGESPRRRLYRLT